MTSLEDKQERKGIVESLTPVINGSTTNPIEAAAKLANSTQIVNNVYNTENGKAVDTTAPAEDIFTKCKAAIANANATKADADDDDVIVTDDVDANDAE